ncbi:protein of unknown function [Pseudomonas inefficax]|uniref:Uncharacterized protein n=1 Tax=Pseudomonas inefficax TaxID=2078786 RepID=A0AAQ1P562_9PSED|nr:protein of unknown function [Pseudomonas inefficax]
MLNPCHRSAIDVGAGVPANTGEAGAIHRVACFAGTPAPTLIALRRDLGVILLNGEIRDRC